MDNYWEAALDSYWGFGESVYACSVLSNSLWPHGLEAYQVPLSMGFSRQEYWSGLSFTSPRDLLTQGSNLYLLWLLHCRQIVYHWATWEAVERLPGSRPRESRRTTLEKQSHWTLKHEHGEETGRPAHLQSNLRDRRRDCERAAVVMRGWIDGWRGV